MARDTNTSRTPHCRQHFMIGFTAFTLQFLVVFDVLISYDIMGPDFTEFEFKSIGLDAVFEDVERLLMIGHPLYSLDIEIV